MNDRSSCSSWTSGPLFINLNSHHNNNHTNNNYSLDKFNALYAQVPEHDRLIVDRMVRKRRNELAMQEESQVARQMWEEERRQRQQETLHQNETMTRIMREKREQDAMATEMRLANLRSRDRYLTERLRDELDAKDVLADLRLQRISTVRDHQTNERRQMHWEKAQLIAQNNEESFLDQKLQQQMVIEQLSERIGRAEEQRQRYIEAQRARVQWDNETEQRMHQARMSANQRFDEYQRQRLMDTIRVSDRKTRIVLNNKQRELEASRSQARNSAFLREFVRRSFTPDVNALMMTGTNRSFRSV